MQSGIIYVKGKKVDQRKLRKFLEDLDLSDVEQFKTEDGLWKSPITGDLFETKNQLWGHFGPYLRSFQLKDPKEPTRAGYVRALRRGIEPTAAQRAAHRDYNRNFRKKRRNAVLESTEPAKERVSVPAMSWD